MLTVITHPLPGGRITSDASRFGRCRGRRPNGSSWTGAGMFPDDCPASQGGRPHEGNDENVADPKALVLACAPGRAVLARLWNSSAGYTVAIDHGPWALTPAGLAGNLFSASMHLEAQLLVKEGQQVVRGQPLGEYGRSGNASAEHLHFKLAIGTSYTAATAIDPEPWVHAIIRPGQRHPYVPTLKAWLRALGFSPGASSGDLYGPAWVPRVKAAQTALGETPDGLIGPATRWALARHL